MLNGMERAMAAVIAAEEPRSRQRDVFEIFRKLRGRLPVSGTLGCGQRDLPIARIAQIAVDLLARSRSKRHAAGWT